MRNNQKGFSLIEVIVVVAILALMIGAGLTGYSMVTSRNMKSCVQNINNYLDKTRMNSLSRSDAKMTIYANASEEIFVRMTVKNKSGSDVSEADYKVGKSSLSVYYYTDADDVGHRIDASNQLILSFDRSSGVFKEISPGVHCTKIVVYNGSDNTSANFRSIVLVPETGKYYIE